MWYIVSDAGWSEQRGHADCHVQYGPFGSQAEAQAFRDEPENAYDELGPVVELVWVLEYSEDEADYSIVGTFGEERKARERIVADALDGKGAQQATITAHEVRA